MALELSSSLLSRGQIHRSPPSSSLKGQPQPQLGVLSSSSSSSSSSVSFSRSDLTSSFSSSCSSSSSSSSVTCSSTGVAAIRRTVSTIGTAARKSTAVRLDGVTHGGPACSSRSAVGPPRGVNGAVAETSGDDMKWWERGGAPNLVDVHSTEEFVEALSSAGDKLVVVEFYATWCGSCRALYPKFCRIAAEHLDINFLKVNFEENKPMCKRLNVRVLPFFHVYRGADKRVDSFSCSLSKLQRLRDAIAKHSEASGDDSASPGISGDVQSATAAGASSE